MAHQQTTLKAKVLGHRNHKVAFFVVLLSHSLSFKFLYLPCCFVNRVTAFAFMSYCSIISVVFGLMGEKSLNFSSFQQSSLFFYFFPLFSLFLSFFPLIFLVYLGHGSTIGAGSLHVSKHIEIQPIVHHTNYSDISKCLHIS
jgi:hypothetical protein